MASLETYRFGEFQLDATRRMLTRDDAAVVLNAKAFDLLSYLVENQGRIVSKDEILNEVWKDQFVEEGNLSVQISHLRKALGDNASEPTLIATIPGKGYQFIGEVSSVSGSEPQPQEVHETEGTGRRLIPILAGGILIIAGAVLSVWYFSSTAVERKVSSLAVLPFTNQAEGVETLRYLSEGLAESIILDLSRSPTLRVMSRDSSFKYRTDMHDPSRIGQDLGVEAILSGRIVQMGDSLSVRTELVSAFDGSVIWGERFDRKADDVEKLHRDISDAIARSLRLEITPATANKTDIDQTNDHEAYQLYVLGRHHLTRLTDDGFRKARESFQAAIDKDPKYALAYVGLADSYNHLTGWGAMPPNDGSPLAKAAAIRAIELDPALSEAYSALGVVRLFYDLDLAGAQTAFEQAVKLNPSYAEAHHMQGYAFMIEGRFEAARSSIAKARTLDPLSLDKIIGVGNTYAFERNFEAALAEYRKALEMDSNSGIARWSIGNVLIYQERYDEAIIELERSIQLSGDSPDEPASLAVAYARSGKPEEARRIVRELRENRSHVSPALLATIHAALDEKDAAFTLLDQALREREALIPFLKVDPLFDPLRSDPRFDQLLLRAGF